MKKETAVEALSEYIRIVDKKVYADLQEMIEQCKQMEKEQIIDACNQEEFQDIDGLGIHETISKGEQYYNETFGGEDEN